jgi:membrane protein YdbS with pleckstrin-like domain
MGKRQSGKRKPGKRSVDPRPRKGEPEDDRVVEMFTVAWMLAVFTTLVCELSAVAATWYVQANPLSTRMALLASILIFAALIVGLMSLALMAVVWKLRAIRPPNGISVFALVVGAAPGLLLLLRNILW